MWTNDKLNEIVDVVLSRKLGKALSMLENYLLSRSQQSDLEKLQEIKTDYRLMADYWRKGVADPQRDQLYNKLLKRLYSLTQNILLHDQIRSSSFLSQAYARPRNARNDWSISSLKDDLESFVSSAAMLSLEPEHIRQQKTKELYSNHQRLMNDLFDYIWTSRQWKDSLADAFQEILLSPTIDSTDQQFIVSAMTLSTLNKFDFNKFRVMVAVYEQTLSEHLRQRALVGWALSLDARPASLYPELPQIMNRLLANERCRNELVELQMQVVYCAMADEDSDKIKNEIMPDLIEGERHMRNKGLIAPDEDSLDEILHPDVSEATIERMEQGMRRLSDMQRQGADVYFAGFSQMKRFPFFNTLSNWFLPFYPEHPDVIEKWNNERGSKALQMLTKVGAFCDSDRYSLVMVFDQIIRQMPKDMLDLVEKGEAIPMPVGGEVPIDEQEKPAYFRRQYLQDLYRFYKLFPQRSEFVNPFDNENRVLIDNTLLQVPSMSKGKMEVAKFLAKRQLPHLAVEVLRSVDEEQRDANFCVLMGSLLAKTAKRNAWLLESSPLMYYRQALELEPHHKRALMGYARELFADKNYKGAMEAYQELLGMDEENEALQLNMAVCQVNLQQYEEALKVLYKLNYLHPDDDHVNRVLAWALTLSEKYEQAGKLYDKLLSQEKRDPSDLLNYGYCLWFQKDVVTAVSLMRQFLNEQNDDYYSIEDEFMHTEHELLKSKGITDVEIQLMLDYLIN